MFLVDATRLDFLGNLCVRYSVSGESAPQNLLHRPALGEFVDEFVEDADFAHGGFFDLLDADAADEAGDEGAVGVQPGGVLEEVYEDGLLGDLLLQRFLRVAGVPADHLVELVGGAALFRDLRDIMRIDAGEGHEAGAVLLRGGV